MFLNIINSFWMKFINEINFNGKTILEIAVENGYYGIIRFLLSLPNIDVNIKSVRIIK